jgi:serine/threonine protein kinase
MLDVAPFDDILESVPGVGDVVGEKYRIERVIGRGGMGVVFLARSILLDTSVAIKVVARDPTPALRHRLLTEARAMARIKSDHVVRVFDVEGTPSTLAFIVMEYLEGEPLSDVVRRTGPAPVPEAVRWVLQACEGLAAAHRHGIVHRDLKPANLFLERCLDGSHRIKVLDFGISKVLALDPVGITTHPVGSPLYMAPEQLGSSCHVDARTDIWGLGVVLYELLTSETPFDGRSMLELAVQLRDTAHTPAHAVRPELPEVLSSIIDRCLEKKPEHRWSTVAELASALTRFGPQDSLAIAARVQQILTSSGAERTPFSSDSSSSSAIRRPEAVGRHDVSTMVTTLATLRARRPLRSARTLMSAAALIVATGSTATMLGYHRGEVVTKDAARDSPGQDPTSRTAEASAVFRPAATPAEAEATSNVHILSQPGGPAAATNPSVAEPPSKLSTLPRPAEDRRGVRPRRTAFPVKRAAPVSEADQRGAARGESTLPADPPGPLPIDRTLSL